MSSWFESEPTTDMEEPSDSVSSWIQRLSIVSRRLVQTEFAGAYRSAFLGRGMDFSEVRPYQPGDEVRWIDWNVSARMDEVYVKQFVEERERTVMLVWDASGSMELGSHWHSKRELCAEMAMILAMSAVSNDDRVGLVISNHGVASYLPPKKGRTHTMRLIRDILAWPSHTKNIDHAETSEHPKSVKSGMTEESDDAGKSVEPETSERSETKEDVLRFVYRVAPAHSIVFFFSDFLETIDRSAWQRLARKCDVIPVLVRDPLESSASTQHSHRRDSFGKHETLRTSSGTEDPSETAPSPVAQDSLSTGVLGAPELYLWGWAGFGLLACSLGAMWGGMWLWAALTAVALGWIGTWLWSRPATSALVGLYDLENQKVLWFPLPVTHEPREPVSLPVEITLQEVQTSLQTMGLDMMSLKTSDAPVDALRAFFRRRQLSSSRAKGKNR